MKAYEFLREGADAIEERGKQYDKKDGERSMAATIQAFNAVTGSSMTEPQGWLFMQLLKAVRQHSNPAREHRDSNIDKIAYAGLEAESWTTLNNSRKAPKQPQSLDEIVRNLPPGSKVVRT